MKIEAFKKYQYISFDIFDTLVTRHYMRPVDLFAGMETLLCRQADSYGGFAGIREQSEFDIRKKGNFSREVTLDAVYSEVGRRMQLDDELLQSTKQMELDFENQAIVVNSVMVEFIGRMRAQGKQVLFVTDTYFPGIFIRQLLTDRGLIAKGDRLYVSSELGIMKATGDLFDHVLADLHIKPEALCHVGDNLHSDVEIPAKRGIHTVHYQDVVNNRYEPDSGKDLLLSRLVASSKATRIQKTYHQDPEETIWDVTSDVSAPLIFSFVCWCIQVARCHKLKTVYFLSRDGQIMHRMAEKIISRYYRDDVRVRYLYVSRQALLFPAMTTLDDEAFEWIMAPTALLTPKIILKRINFTPDEFSELLKEYSFAESLDRHLEHDERGRFQNMLREAGKQILARAEQYRDRTYRYLQQEGLTEPGLFGVVDIGWSGTLQRSISRILGLFDEQKPVLGLYFGLKDRKKYKLQDGLFSWFTDLSHQRNLDKKTYIVPMTELFTAADHGGVRSYQEDSGRMVPQLGSENNTTGLAWGIAVQQEAMLAYADCMLELGERSLEEICWKYLDHYENNYARFLLQPTLREAAVYGAYLDAEDQNESYHRQLAGKYSFRELLQVKKNQYKHHHNEWQEGAMKLTGKRMKKLFGLLEDESDNQHQSEADAYTFFYLISYPRSGNTWMVNSLKDYLNAQRAEIMPSPYGGEEIVIDDIQVKVAGSCNRNLPIGIKTHMSHGEFVKRNVPQQKIVYLLRDVRDVMVSYYFYINSYMKKGTGKEEGFSDEKFSDHLLDKLPGYKQHVTGWLKEYRGDILTIRYEEMKADYIASLQKIKLFLMIESAMDVNEVKKRYVDDFQRIDGFNSVLKGNNSDFYRKGIVGDWKNYFSKVHKDIVKKELGALLIDLGYEQDLSW